MDFYDKLSAAYNYQQMIIHREKNSQFRGRRDLA